MIGKRSSRRSTNPPPPRPPASPVRVRRNPCLSRRRRIDLSIRILRRPRAQMPHSGSRRLRVICRRRGMVHHRLPRITLCHSHLFPFGHRDHPSQRDIAPSSGCRILLPCPHKGQRRTPQISTQTRSCSASSSPAYTSPGFSAVAFSSSSHTCHADSSNSLVL